MVRHYDSEHEAYATRHELREQRLQRVRNSPAAPTVVSLVDRYMFDLQGFFVVRVRKGRLHAACHNFCSLRWQTLSLTLSLYTGRHRRGRSPRAQCCGRRSQR